MEATTLRVISQKASSMKCLRSKVPEVESTLLLLLLLLLLLFAWFPVKDIVLLLLFDEVLLLE